MAVIIYYSENNSCLSSQSQTDVANNVFTPSAAATSNIGLCQIYDSDEKVCKLHLKISTLSKHFGK